MPSGVLTSPKPYIPGINDFGAAAAILYPVIKLQYSNVGYHDGKSYSAPFS